MAGGWPRTGLPADKTGDTGSFAWRNGEGSRLEEATDHFLRAFYPRRMIRAFDEWPDSSPARRLNDLGKCFYERCSKYDCLTRGRTRVCWNKGVGCYFSESGITDWAKETGIIF